MSNAYRAVIHNDQVKWDGDPPPQLRDGRAAHAEVIFVEDISNAGSGPRMAAALAKLASGATGLPDDPDQWLRETRTERELPGRS